MIMPLVRRSLALVAAALGASALLAAAGLATGTAVPSNTSLPSISGSARDGSILTGHHGSWSSNPSAYAYQWLRCDNAGGGCAPVGGATSQQYTIASADVGLRLRVQVTASNSSGSGMATSQATGAVVATGTAPRNTSKPAIAGTPKEGSALTVSVGAWSGTQPISYTYQWRRCDGAGANCADIAGATGSSYTPVAADVAHTLVANVVAKNGRGSASASTPASALVAPGSPGSGQAVSVTQVVPPARLVVDRVSFAPSRLRSRAPFVARFHVSDTRGFSVQGALVYALGLPYAWTGNAPEVPTDATGWATVTMRPTSSLPLRRGALVVFVRARKSGDDLLAGVSTRRLVQVGIR
jgi:hypothetical protein